VFLDAAIRRSVSRLLEVPLVAAFSEWLDGRMPNRMGELGMICQAFEFAKINCVEGDYFEFGLYRGKTFAYAHRMKYRFGRHNMKLWGFDSFQGLPQISEKRDNVWTEGEFACSEKELRHILRRRGFSEAEYELIPGFYEDSLNDALHQKLRGRTAAIVYVDCDLYESTASVLCFLFRYLRNGTIICFDDYYCYKGAPDQGEQRAVAEFLATHANVRFIPYFDYSALGKAFIVRVAEEEMGNVRVR